MTALHRPHHHYLVLFSPAFVLIVWAILLALDHGNLSAGTMVVFLLILAASVVAAESVRIHLRRQIRKERDRERRLK